MALTLPYSVVRDLVSSRFLIVFIDESTGIITAKAETNSQTEANTLVSGLNS